MFIGVELPDSVRGACVTWMRAVQPFLDARFTLPENLHMTLAFIGETDPARLDELHTLLAERAAHFAPSALSLGAADVFSKRGGGILHLRVESDPPLSPLHDALRHALLNRGFSCDPGPFAPHITLARKVKSPQIPPIPVPAAAFVPAHLTVFESARDAQDVLRYTPLCRCAWTGEI